MEIPSFSRYRMATLQRVGAASVCLLPHLGYLQADGWSAGLAIAGNGLGDTVL